MRRKGMKFDPDPCAFGCVWESFDPRAADWLTIFRQVTKEWNHEKKGKQFEVDWSAINLVFDAYEIEDRKEGINLIWFMMRLMTEGLERPVTPEQLFGWEPMPGEE